MYDTTDPEKNENAIKFEKIISIIQKKFAKIDWLYVQTEDVVKNVHYMNMNNIQDYANTQKKSAFPIGILQTQT